MRSDIIKDAHRAAHAISSMLLALAFLGFTQTSLGQPLQKNMTDSEKKATIESMYHEYRGSFPDVREISARELAERRKKEDLVIVDVRAHDERAVSIIPGSISKKEFEAHIGELRKKPIVVHCTIGYRSGKYAEELKKKGIEALNLEGSVLSWVHEGLPVVDKDGRETKRVHVYSSKWNLLPEGYEAVW